MFTCPPSISGHEHPLLLTRIQDGFTGRLPRSAQRPRQRNHAGWGASGRPGRVRRPCAPFPPAQPLFPSGAHGAGLEGQASIERSDAVASVALFRVPEPVGRRGAQLDDIESEFLQGRIQRVANMMISAFVASFTNSPAGSRTRFSLSALQLLKWSAAISSAGRPPTTRYNAMPWDCKSS